LNNSNNPVSRAAGEYVAEVHSPMNPNEILRIVDAIHRDKNIGKEIVFEGIEAALVSALKKHYGEEAEITCRDRPRRPATSRRPATAKSCRRRKSSAALAPRPPSR
jgi:hypothetical protein